MLPMSRVTAIVVANESAAVNEWARIDEYVGHSG